uniref:TBC1 domain family member 10B n=1 Tax=Chelonoidis abingdonii TaxID=106734 RepID=A0A8C0GFI8_CHEAB
GEVSSGRRGRPRPPALMSGTLESLSGPGFSDDVSSLGSDSEINGLAYRRTDKYGFLGGPGTGWLTGVGNGPQGLSPLGGTSSHLFPFPADPHSQAPAGSECVGSQPRSVQGPAWQPQQRGRELWPGSAWSRDLSGSPRPSLSCACRSLPAQPRVGAMPATRLGPQQDLYRILKAYTIYRPDEGYCQAQAPVAAVLLMHMPAEQAFWCLVQICEKYLPGYYSAGLEAIQLDGEIFFALLRRASPMAYRHLKKYKIDPILYMTEWFMCIFSRTLPWASVLRVWDMFFCEGVKIVFRVGLVLLRNTLGSVDKLRSCQGMYETMEKLRNLPAQSMQEDFLILEVRRPPCLTRGRCPGAVVSEGLHPALPSPTGNNTPLGGPKKGGAKKKEKEREKQEKERERLQKEREKQEKERERLQKEREKQEKKEKEKLERKQQKERAKEEAKQKKERKVSMRRKEAKAPPRAEDGGQDGDPPAGSVLQDTYF